MKQYQTSYDSRPDTLSHILRVRELLYIAQNKLEARGFAHDLSKLQSPEKEVFDTVTPKLRGLTYGSEEYKASLAEMGVALRHHYAANSHHPEHFKKWVCNICFWETCNPSVERCDKCSNAQFTEEGDVSQMTLLDVLEMLCDWKAATERHADGSIEKSLAYNQKRFQISDQLAAILKNTAIEMGWL